MKRLNVSVEDELHASMKSEAARQGKTIIDYVTDAIREKLENDQQKKDQGDE